MDSSERWMQLAALAERENDPKKLIELIAEINQLLSEKLPPLPDRQPQQPTSIKNGTH
jgi:hypothetical protein